MPRRVLNKLRAQLGEPGRTVVEGGEDERPFRVAEVDDSRPESMGCLELVGETGVLHGVGKCEDEFILHGDTVDNHANSDPPKEGLANGTAPSALDDPGAEAVEEQRDDRLLGTRGRFLVVGQPSVHPAGKDLFERTVEGPARKAGVEIGP
jgi:hypothetical protein